MTKLIAGVLKKVPVPGIEFSNQQFSGGVEVEIPDDADDEAVRRRLRELYVLLSETVEAEITAATETAREAGFQARFPNPVANSGDREAGQTSTGRRRGYGAEEQERSFRRGRDEDDRDRGYRRDYGDRQGFRGSERRDDCRDSGSRSGGSWPGRNGNGGGNGRSGSATQAQIKAVFGIAKGQGIERRDILERVEEQFGVRRVEDLNIRQASQLIEQLKAA